MNREDNRKIVPEPKTSFFKLDSKIKDVLIIGSLALILTFFTWKIFNKTEKDDASLVSATLSEQKVARILSQIDGVGEAEVMVSETEEGVLGVVVVCDGAKDIQVIMNIREAVSAALGAEEKNVKIYLKK